MIRAIDKIARITYKRITQHKRNYKMKLLTKAILAKLIKNNLDNADGDKDQTPVLKLFGGGACTWLITELNPEDNTMFGLCDLGFGFPELGYVSLTELEELTFPPFGLGVERDLHFKANGFISEYASTASEKGRIVQI